MKTSFDNSSCDGLRAVLLRDPSLQDVSLRASR